MKKNKILIIIFLLPLSFGNSQNKVNVNNLVQYGEKFFKENDDEPFTGLVFDIDKTTGNKILNYKMVNGLKNGFYKEFHPNGNKKSEGNYKKGLMNGEWNFWYENGQKECEGKYKNGDGSDLGNTGLPKNGRSGLWTWWYENGQKEGEGTFKDGKFDGLVTQWYENGQMKSEGTIKDRKVDGVWTFWYENGKKKEVGNITNDRKDGLWTYWYANGKKKFEGVFIDNEKNGIWTAWGKYDEKEYKGRIERKNDEDGTFISFRDDHSLNPKLHSTYKNGKEDGLWTYWYDNGRKRAEGGFIDGEENGLWTYWNFDGRIKKKGTFKKGIMTDLWTWYDTKGYEEWIGKKEYEIYVLKGIEHDHLSDYHFKDYNKMFDYIMRKNILVNKKTRYSGGVKIEEILYQDGEENGLSTSWHPNGKKEFEVIMKDGEYDGLYTSWNQNGQMSSKKTYKNGILIKDSSSHTLNTTGISSIWYGNTMVELTQDFVDNEIDKLITKWTPVGPEFLDSQKLKYSEDRFHKYKKFRSKIIWVGEKVYKGKYMDTFENIDISSLNGSYILSGDIFIKFKNGIQVGLAVDLSGLGRHEDGIIEKGTLKYTEGWEKDGLWTGWYKNDIKKNELYYENGEIIFYKNLWSLDGKRLIEDGNGKDIEFYPNGEKAGEITYKKGKKDGLITGWYKNGQKNVEYVEKNGRLFGKAFEWDEDGIPTHRKLR